VIFKVRDFCQGATIVIARPQRQKNLATPLMLQSYSTLLRS